MLGTYLGVSGDVRDCSCCISFSSVSCRCCVCLRFLLWRLCPSFRSQVVPVATKVSCSPFSSNLSWIFLCFVPTMSCSISRSSESIWICISKLDCGKRKSSTHSSIYCLNCCNWYRVNLWLIFWRHVLFESLPYDPWVISIFGVVQGPVVIGV